MHWYVLRRPFSEVRANSEKLGLLFLSRQCSDLRAGSVITANGPPLYRASLPYDAYRAALEQQGISSVLSEAAGGTSAITYFTGLAMKSTNAN